MAEAPRRVAGIDRDHFMLLFGATLVASMGNTTLITFTPAIGRQLKIDDLVVAMMFTASATMWTFFAPFWGRKADRMDRRWLLMFGSCGYALSMVLVGLVFWAGLSGAISPMLTMLLFVPARAIYGIAGSATPPAAQAYVASHTTTADRTYALGLLASAQGLGTVLGPAVAPLLIFAPLGLTGPLFILGLVALLLVVAIRRRLPADKPSQSSREQAAQDVKLSWTDRRIRRLLLFATIMGSIQAAIVQTLGFHVIDVLKVSPGVAVGFISITVMVGAAATLLAQWGMIRLFQLSPSQLLWGGMLVSALGSLLMGLAEDFHTLVTGYGLSSLGFGLTRPGISGILSLSVEAHRQGDIAGKLTGIYGAVFIIGPSFGVSAYKIDPDGTFFLLALLCATLALPWFRRHPAQS
jgi:MFS family permease